MKWFLTKGLTGEDVIDCDVNGFSATAYSLGGKNWKCEVAVEGILEVSGTQAIFGMLPWGMQ
eukprot:1454979-Ditylum_brightwellii.AAC.1